MLQEGNETVTNCDTFKLKAKNGKMRNTDMLDTEGIFRLIESVPSPKAEPFKQPEINMRVLLKKQLYQVKEEIIVK